MVKKAKNGTFARKNSGATRVKLRHADKLGSLNNMETTS